MSPKKEKPQKQIEEMLAFKTNQKIIHSQNNPLLFMCLLTDKFNSSSSQFVYSVHRHISRPSLDEGFPISQKI